MRRAIVVDERLVVEADGVDERAYRPRSGRTDSPYHEGFGLVEWGTFNQMRRASAFPEKTITTFCRRLQDVQGAPSSTSKPGTPAAVHAERAV